MKFYIGSSFQNCDLVNHYSKILEANGWTHTYNWTRNGKDGLSMEALAGIAQREQTAIGESDVVIILLPAGRGTHIELGMALALRKKVFLCAAGEEAFSIDNTVNFYQLPEIVRLAGTPEENISEILK